MATEKILNTRLQLKYDTLANWNSSTFIPKKGEACIVEVPTGTSVTGVVNPPAIMIKVGNGTDKFSALPWTAATAADVYTWAKKNQLPVEVVDNGTGTFVTDVVGAWDATNNKYTLTLSRSNVGMTITEATGTNDGKYVTGLVWDKATETLKPQMVAFDATLSDTSTNAPQTQAVKAYVDQEVTKAVSGGVAGLATKTYVDTQDAAILAAAKKYADDNEKTTSVSSGSSVITVAPTTTNNNTDYKVSIDLSGYQAKGNYKTTQTAVANKTASTKIITTLTQNANGVISYDVTDLTPATIGAQPAGNYKTTQTAVADKITDDAHVLTSLTQDTNGVISYEVKKLTPANIGAVSTSDFTTFKSSNTTAINTAASTAKTEAISAASTDASTKANTAESNAKKYTDDEIVGLELEHSGQSIVLKNKAGTTVATLDASAFYVDGMVSNATYNADTNKLTITFNTAAGKSDIEVDLNDLVDVYTGGTGITVGTDGKISLTTAVQTSLGKADTAVQSVQLTTESLSGLGYVYGLKVNGTEQITNDIEKLTSKDFVSKSIDNATGDLNNKTVKKYVDDAVAGIVAGEVKNAEYATKAAQDASGQVITTTYETKNDAAQKLTDAKAYTDAEIKKLDVSDTAVTNQYVSAVSETDGKVSVSRTELPVYSVTVSEDTVKPGMTSGTAYNLAVNGDIITETPLVCSDYLEEYVAVQTGLSTTGKTVKKYVDDKIDEAVAYANGQHETKTDATAKLNAAKKYTDDAIAGLDSVAGTGTGTVAGDHEEALTSIVITNGKISSYKTNENLTGYIEDLDQREGTVLVFDCGSATKNI